MDVHRDFVIACIASTNAQGVTEYQSRRFSTYTGGLRDCAVWLEENNCKDVCMESTGKYWFPVHNILEKTCRVVVTHPKFVKAIKGKKTDKKDAMWIADLFKHDVVSSSFIPPERIRQLRDLCRYLQKLTWITAGEKNRAQNCLTVSNLKLDSVFSNVFGKSASAIISFMLEHPGEPFDVTPFVHGRCKSPIEDIQAAIDGAFSPWQAEKLKVIREHMADLGKCKQMVENLIIQLAEPYKRQIELILTVPGVSDPMTAIRIIAEIGADMTQFESSKHLCSWAGLTPQNNESAGKKKTTRIGKAGQYIKPLLIECSIGAANPRSKKYPEIARKYQQLRKRRGAKKARVAIARRLLTAIYQMLLKDEPYQPFVAPAGEDIPKQRVMTAEDALAMLRRKGFILVDAAGAVIEGNVVLPAPA
jgi:transposase